METFELKESLEQPLHYVLGEVSEPDLSVESLLRVQTQLVSEVLRLQGVIASLQKRLRKRRKQSPQAPPPQSPEQQQLNVSRHVRRRSSLGKRAREELPKARPLKQSRLDRMEWLLFDKGWTEQPVRQPSKLVLNEFREVESMLMGWLDRSGEDEEQKQCVDAVDVDDVDVECKEDNNEEKSGHDEPVASSNVDCSHHAEVEITDTFYNMDFHLDFCDTEEAFKVAIPIVTARLAIQNGALLTQVGGPLGFVHAIGKLVTEMENAGKHSVYAEALIICEEILKPLIGRDQSVGDLIRRELGEFAYHRKDNMTVDFIEEWEDWISLMAIAVAGTRNAAARASKPVRRKKKRGKKKRTKKRINLNPWVRLADQLRSEYFFVAQPCNHFVDGCVRP